MKKILAVLVVSILLISCQKEADSTIEPKNVKVYIKVNGYDGTTIRDSSSVVTVY